MSVIYVQSVIDTAAVWVGFAGTTVFLAEYTALGLTGRKDARLRWWRSHAGRAIVALDVGLWFVFAPVSWLLLTHDETKAAVLAILDNTITTVLAFNWFILTGLVIAATVPVYRSICLLIMYLHRRRELCKVATDADADS